MAYQTVTHNSYGSRVKKSAGGVGTGFLMLIAGIVLLFWNEGRTVKMTRTIKEIESGSRPISKKNIRELGKAFY